MSRINNFLGGCLMVSELERFFMHMRPAFSRRATYAWFIVVFVGFLMRCDNFGVSSIIRALSLSPSAYPCLLHFFHSHAWTTDTLMIRWWDWLDTKNLACLVNERLVFPGDHTKTIKDARKMPAASTLHQDFETCSKPSFFRGHHWDCIAILWKPAKGMIRFILVESSRGRIIIMTSDLNLNPVIAAELYCRRVTIETMFDTLKNILGGFTYHFWSRYLSPVSKKPKKNKDVKQRFSDPAKTMNTFRAIEKFVNVQLLILGMLQLIATCYPDKVKKKAQCWLRTYSSNTPSEFVSKMALSNCIKTFCADMQKT